MSTLCAKPIVGFRRLTLEDEDLYQKYFKQSHSGFAENQFTLHMAWNTEWNFHLAEEEACLIISYYESIRDGIYFDSPLGLKSADQLRSLVDKLWYPYAEFSRAFQNQSLPSLHILYISEKDIPYYETLEKAGYKIELSLNRDYMDYVYDAEKLRSLSGKKLHSKRNHIHQFWAKYPNARFEFLEPKHYSACLNLTRTWAIEKGLNLLSPSETDYGPISSLLATPTKLKLHGGCLFVGDELLAFAVYSPLYEGMTVCHYEKAKADVPEAFAVINQLCVKNCFPTAVEINREDDMGLEGLRKAKLSYRPIRLLPKYEAKIYKEEDLAESQYIIEERLQLKGFKEEDFQLFTPISWKNKEALFLPKE